MEKYVAARKGACATLLTQMETECDAVLESSATSDPQKATAKLVLDKLKSASVCIRSGDAAWAFYHGVFAGKHYETMRWAALLSGMTPPPTVKWRGVTVEGQAAERRALLFIGNQTEVNADALLSASGAKDIKKLLHRVRTAIKAAGSDARIAKRGDSVLIDM